MTECNRPDCPGMTRCAKESCYPSRRAEGCDECNEVGKIVRVAPNGCLVSGGCSHPTSPSSCPDCNGTGTVPGYAEPWVRCPNSCPIPEVDMTPQPSHYVDRTVLSMLHEGCGRQQEGPNDSLWQCISCTDGTDCTMGQVARPPAGRSSLRDAVEMLAEYYEGKADDAAGADGKSAEIHARLYERFSADLYAIHAGLDPFT